MGFDLVCSTPKSVSLLWAVGDDALRADIAAAFDVAVEATLAYLEQHGCYGVVDGRNQHGEGLGVVSYVHDISRANEAHLHTHNLIVNAVRVVVRDGDGQTIVDRHGAPRVEWRALDSGALMRHVTTAGYLGAAELRHQLSTRWGVPWERIHNGVAEIADFPSELLRAFSTRHDQVEEEFAQMVEAGFEPGAATEVAAQRASRAPKRVLADAAVRKIQTDKLGELGWTPAQVRRLVSDQSAGRPATVTDADLAELRDLLVGPVGLTERQTTFTLREVHQAVAQWAGDRLPARRIRAIAEEFLADPRVVLCAPVNRSRTRQDPDPVFTAEGLLASEDNLLTIYRQGRVDHGARHAAPVLDAAVAQAVAAINAALAAERGDPQAGLSPEQADLVWEVVASGDLIRCVIGPAGTGKTEAMRAAVVAWRSAGCRVVGCANGGAQTEQLATRLGVDARVVRSWLTRLDTADDPSEIWPDGTVVLIDEATQISTRDAERLCRWAVRTGTVLVFVGDPAQLSSVGAGGWFRHVVYGHGAPALSTVYRQRGDDMAEVRAALSGLRSEMPQRVRTAMDRLVRDGRVSVFDRPDDLLAQVVDDWYHDRQQRQAAKGQGVGPKPSQMMAAHRREVEALNTLARTKLITDGTITGEELVAGQRRFAVGDEVVTLTQAGHTLVPADAPRDRYIRTGTIGVITEVHVDADHPHDQGLIVHFPGRGTVNVDWTYLTHEFPDGRSGGLAHSYAITADRAQGSTMHSSRAVTTDSTSRPAFYVMVSRGEREICAYVIRERDMEGIDDDEPFLPVLTYPGGSLQAVVEHLEQSRAERLAGDLDPIAWHAHQLRRHRTLAELSVLRAHLQANPRAGSGDVTLIVARRAELAEEAAIGAAAITQPTPELVARLGPRPVSGHHQRAWDAAVRAVSVYQTRWSASSGVAGQGHGASWAIGPRPKPERSDWAEHRNQAEQLILRWAATLDSQHRQRFFAVIERIPRERAAAAVHALLAAGIDPGQIYAHLTERERETVNAGAAVLEHRVNNLLRAHRVDPAPYHMAQPLTQAAEWDRVSRLLNVAEAANLSRQPLVQLVAERQQTQQLVAGHAAPADSDRLAQEFDAAQARHAQMAAHLDDAGEELAMLLAHRRPDRRQVDELRRLVARCDQERADQSLAISMLNQRIAATRDGAQPHEALRKRHQLLTLAIDLLVDEAARRFAVQPAGYLTALLGPQVPTRRSIGIIRLGPSKAGATTPSDSPTDIQRPRAMARHRNKHSDRCQTTR
jgi:conjugative relaxase-like TrwC/TraI family protein